MSKQELEREVSAWRAKAPTWIEAVKEARERAEAAEARCAELLKTLRSIAFEPFGPADASDEQVLNAITDLARAVVAKAEGGR